MECHQEDDASELDEQDDSEQLAEKDLEHLKYKPSLQLLGAEMYSASVDDVNTVGCLKVMRLIRPPSMITRLPENDFLLAMSCALCKSVVMVIFALSFEVSLLSVSTEGVWMVAFR